MVVTAAKAAAVVVVVVVAVAAEFQKGFPDLQLRGAGPWAEDDSNSSHFGVYSRVPLFWETTI